MISCIAVQIEEASDESGDARLQYRPPTEFAVDGHRQARRIPLRIVRILLEPPARQLEPAVGDVVHLAVGHLHIGPGHGAVDAGHARKAVGLDDGGRIGCVVAGVLHLDALVNRLADRVDGGDEREEEEENGKRRKNGIAAVVTAKGADPRDGVWKSPRHQNVTPRLAPITVTRSNCGISGKVSVFQGFASVQLSVRRME